MGKLKQFIKKKIKNQVYYYIEEHKDELLNDFYYNVAIDSKKKTLSEIELEKSKKEDEICSRLEVLEREHNRRQWEHVWYAYSRWWTEGASEELLKEFEYKERFFDFWEDEQPSYWLIYIAILLELGQKAKALDISKKYLRYFGHNEIYKSMAVSSFFSEANLAEEQNIKKSAEIEGILRQKQENEKLEEYLSRASNIAIVGSSRREVGRGLGAEIDNHDIVIRLNGGILNDEIKTVEDYGKKCNIWARNGDGKFLLKAKDVCFGKAPKFIIYCDDYYHGFIHSSELFNILYEDVTSDDYTTCIIPSRDHFELRNESQLINPTSGAYLIWYLYKVLGSLKKVDFYGFSFIDNKMNESDFEAEGFGGQHFMDREMNFLYNLWEKNS